MSKRTYINNSYFVTEASSLERNVNPFAFANAVIFPGDGCKFQSTILGMYLDHFPCGHCDIRFPLPFTMLGHHPFSRNGPHNHHFFGSGKSRQTPDEQCGQ